MKQILCQVTLKASNPSALELKQSLKGIAISSFQVKGKGSYNFKEQNALDDEIDYFALAREHDENFDERSDIGDLVKDEFQLIPLTDIISDSELTLLEF